MVYIPGGEFEMGSGEGEGSADERPRHRVELTGYWIGMYAETTGQYRKFVEEAGYRARDNTKHRESRLVKHPVTKVDWSDSKAYAKWAGCELASEAQWEKACRGPLGLEYPWGREWDAGRCRNNENRGKEETCEVHEYPRGVSGYRTYNQSGHVWEWCADWYGAKYYGESAKVAPRGLTGGLGRVSRGGGWWGVAPGFLRAAYRCGNVPGGHNDLRGLRLVKTASCVRAWW